MLPPWKPVAGSRFGHMAAKAFWLEWGRLQVDEVTKKHNYFGQSCKDQTNRRFPQLKKMWV